MKLEDWINGVRNCPDDISLREQKPFSPTEMHLLTWEFGIYNNFPVLIRGAGEDIARAIEESSLCSFLGKSQRQRMYEDKSTGRRITLIPWLTGLELRGTEQEQEIQKENYSSALRLFLGIAPEEMGQSAEFMIRLINVLKDKRFPFCLPESYGWKCHQPPINENLLEISKRIVYSPDEDEIKMSKERTRMKE